MGAFVTLSERRPCRLLNQEKTYTLVCSFTHAPKFTHPCHSTEGKGHGLTKGTRSDQERREEKARKSSFLTCIWPPDGL